MFLSARRNLLAKRPLSRLLSTETTTTQRERILQTCLAKVPEEGFEKALINGIRESGYSDVTHNLFSHGVFDLVGYHLVKQRTNLSSVDLTDFNSNHEKLVHLVQQRLKSNKEIEPRLSEALTIMTQPSNLLQSVNELHQLSDELWYLANDRSPDFSWYTKRAALSSMYVASELFMAQDKSTDYRDTMDFVSHRLSEIETTGYMVGSTFEWVKFNSMASFNVLKSLTRG